MKPVTVSIERKPFDFSFAKRIGPRFAEKLAADFSDATADLSLAYTRANFRELRAFIRWLADKRLKHPPAVQRIVEQLRDALLRGDGTRFPEDLFLQTCEHYARRYRDSKSRFARHHATYRLRNFKGALSRLSNGTSLPPCTRGLAVQRNLDGPTRGHPPLAALTKSGVVTWRSSGELESSVTAALKEAGLSPELLSIDERARAMGALNEARLGRLRSLLEKELLVEAAAFEHGRQLMDDPSLPSDAEIAEGLRSRGRKTQNRFKWFDLESRGSVRRGLALILRYYRLHGSTVTRRFPSAFHTFLSRPDVRDELQISRRMPPRSGSTVRRDCVQHALQRRLTITMDSWMPAVGLLLCDTGWNLSALLSLTADPFIGSVSLGQRRIARAHVISAFKERAGHDVHAGLVELSNDDRQVLDALGPDSVLRLDTGPRDGISAYQALLLIQRMTAPLRARPEAPDLLWLCPVSRAHGVPVPKFSTYHHYWRALLVRHKHDSVIGGLPITLAMIRKTRLEISAMAGPAGFADALARGQHTEAASRRYYLKSAWVQHALMENIRIFQDALEATLGQNIEGLAACLGIDEATWHSRIAFGRESGLGSMVASPDPHVPPASRLKFVPTGDALAQLHAVDHVLTQQGAALAAASPREWTVIFYPFFVRVRAVIDALDITPAGTASRTIRRRMHDAVN